MAASMWEVTRLILGGPGDAAEVSEVAQAHGFSAAEVADLLPLFLDNVSVDWAASAGGLGTAPPQAAVGEGADELAARWLADLGLRLQGQAGVVDVVSYDAFGAAGLDEFDPGLDGFDDLGSAAARDVPVSAGDPAPAATFGRGDEAAGADEARGGGAAEGGEDPVEETDDLADLDDGGLHGFSAVDDLPDDPAGHLTGQDAGAEPGSDDAVDLT